MRTFSLRSLAILGLAACPFTAAACDGKPKAAAPQPYTLSSLNLPNDGKSAGKFEFKSSYASGSVELAPEVHVDFELDIEGKSQKTILRVAQGELHLDGPELRIGNKSFGALEGQVRIRIGRDGVFVNGGKRGDL